jgi:3-(3-hydroxy-phenyl)propionate hydroxylase
MEEYSVVIVGYGPTGLTLAALLGQQGHKVLVLERWPELYGKARLSHIDAETVRLLSFACDIDAAMRDSSAITSYKYFNGRGAKILDLVDIPTRPMGHPPHNSIFQPHIEDALDARAKSCPNVTILQGYEMTHLEAQDGGATLRYRTPQGETKTVTARFVFGADGANSPVREAMAIDRDDSGFRERWLNIDGVFTGKLPEGLRDTVQYCDPERGRMTMPIGKTRRRFEFAILRGEKTEEMQTPEGAGRLLKRYFGLDLSDLKIERLIVYQFEARSARTWKRGNVLIGGDAAHTMPPALGQGACSAIRDAANLAWKLDFVLRGLASETVLDTYESERRPHVSFIQKTSIKLAEIANTHNRLKAFMRDLIMRMNILPPPPPFPPIGAGIKQDAKGKSYEAWIGDVPPHGRVAIDGVENWFDAFAGYKFSIIASDMALRGLTPPQHAFLAQIGCNLFSLDSRTACPGARAVKDLDGRFETFLKDTGAAAMILRPDTNLFGLAEGPAELSALVDHLEAKLGSPVAIRKAA